MQFQANSMESSSSWEADSRSAGQISPHLLLHPKIHYSLNLNPPLDSIQINLHLAHTSHPILKI
jgi:hypothetical protein